MPLSARQPGLSRFVSANALLGNSVRPVVRERSRVTLTLELFAYKVLSAALRFLIVSEEISPMTLTVPVEVMLSIYDGAVSARYPSLTTPPLSMQ